jgi:hypothetical protein
MTANLPAIGSASGGTGRYEGGTPGHTKWRPHAENGTVRDTAAWRGRRCHLAGGPGGRRLASSPVSYLSMLLPASPIATTVAAYIAATLTANHDSRRHEWGRQAAKIGVRARETARGDTRRQVRHRASEQAVLSLLRYRCGDPPSSLVPRRRHAVRPGAERDQALATTPMLAAKGMTFSDSGRLHLTPRGMIFHASTTFATRGGSGRHA